MRVANAQLSDQLEEIGFGVERQGRNVHLRGGMGAVNRLIERAKEGNLAVQRQGQLARVQSNFTMKSDDPYESGSERARWCGGTPKDLMRDLGGGIDMAPFKAEQQKLARSGLQQKILTRIANVVPRRRRAMSEHDGEWDFGRRWDLKPFAATQKTLSSGRVIDVICHFAVNSSSGAEEINAYGAMAWAISDLIESCGVSTRIVCEYSVDVVDEGSKYDQRIEIEVKKPGQYIAPNMIAASFQSNFFRRAVFAMLEIGCDLVGTTAKRGLGHAKDRFPRLHNAEGRLELSTSVRYAGAEELEAAILEAVTGKKQATPEEKSA